jgi:hypothetical protein
MKSQRTLNILMTDTNTFHRQVSRRQDIVRRSTHSMACHKTKGTPARTTRKQAVGVDSSVGGEKMMASSLHVDSEFL